MFRLIAEAAVDATTEPPWLTIAKILLGAVVSVVVVAIPVAIRARNKARSEAHPVGTQLLEVAHKTIVLLEHQNRELMASNTGLDRELGDKRDALAAAWDREQRLRRAVGRLGGDPDELI